MNPALRLAASLGLLATAPALAAAAPPPAAAPQPGPGFVFNLLPRAFQKNPQVDFNVITEMTDAGRRARKPAPGEPLYYITKPAGYLKLGHGAGGREKPPEVEKMEAVLERSLAASGYLGATPDHRPSVVIIYSWGSHSNPLIDNDPEDEPFPNKVLIDEMIERARLVGGEKFAQEFIKAMAEAGSSRSAIAKPRVDPTGAVPTQPNVLGDAAGMMTQIFSPVELFRNRSEKTRSLMEDIGASIYFVVASAYDYDSVARDQKVLLWRTRMSVNSAGVAMTETLPALIAAAGPYFGRDMTEVEIVNQRLNREGQIEIGTPEVISFSEGPAAPPPPGPIAPATGKP